MGASPVMQADYTENDGYWITKANTVSRCFFSQF
jgi:hypothetical protein